MFMTVDYVREMIVKKSCNANMDCLSICSSSLKNTHTHTHTHTQNHPSWPRLLHWIMLQTQNGSHTHKHTCKCKCFFFYLTVSCHNYITKLCPWKTYASKHCNNSHTNCHPKPHSYHNVYFILSSVGQEHHQVMKHHHALAEQHFPFLQASVFVQGLNPKNSEVLGFSSAFLLVCACAKFESIWELSAPEQHPVCNPWQFSAHCFA